MFTIRHKLHIKTVQRHQTTHRNGRLIGVLKLVPDITSAEVTSSMELLVRKKQIFEAPRKLKKQDKWIKIMLLIQLDRNENTGTFYIRGRQNRVLIYIHTGLLLVLVNEEPSRKGLQCA
jgi:hypothetical protein